MDVDKIIREGDLTFLRRDLLAALKEISRGPSRVASVDSRHCDHHERRLHQLRMTLSGTEWILGEALKRLEKLEAANTKGGE